MKHSLRFLQVSFFILFLSTTVFAQWVAQTSGSTARLRYLKAVSPTVVWGCGGSGEVFRTTDGGTTWTKTVTLAGATNYCIEAFDAQTAWVTGTVGGSADVSIWKTTDGGTTFTSQFNNPTGFGDAIKFFNSNDGVYIGDPDPYPSKYWEIYTTSNGGGTWTRVPKANIPDADSANGEYGAASSVCVIGNTIWFTGYSGAAGTQNSVYKSTNKGLNWTKSSFPNTSGSSGSCYVAFKNANEGLVVTLDGTVAKTTDGGATWTTSSVTGAAFRQIVNLNGSSRYLAVGNSGAAWITYNDGATWSPITPLNTNTLYAVTHFNGIPWAAGNSGTILKWNGSPLPVEFASFASEVSDNNVILKWSTASEKNNRSFEIERKAVDGEFVLRGFIAGAGTSTEIKNYSFTDEAVEAGKYIYRIKQIDFDGRYAYSDEIEVEVTNPGKFELSQNYPNPFNPSTTIAYKTKVDGFVTLKVYDYTGTEVATLVSENQKSGSYQVVFNASGLASGIYFYTITAPGYSETKKLTLIK